MSTTLIRNYLRSLGSEPLGEEGEALSDYEKEQFRMAMCTHFSVSHEQAESSLVFIDVLPAAAIEALQKASSGEAESKTTVPEPAPVVSPEPAPVAPPEPATEPATQESVKQDSEPPESVPSDESVANKDGSSEESGNSENEVTGEEEAAPKSTKSSRREAARAAKANE